MPFGSDQWATLAIALVALLALVLLKRRDVQERRASKGAAGYRAPGRAAVPDPRRPSRIFDQDDV